MRSHRAPRTGPYSSRAGLQVARARFPGPNAQLEAALSFSIKWAGQLPPKQEGPWLHTNTEDWRTSFSRLSLQTFSKRRKVYRDLGLAKRGASGGMETLRIARVGGSDLESFIAQKIKIKKPHTHTNGNPPGLHITRNGLFPLKMLITKRLVWM